MRGMGEELAVGADKAKEVERDAGLLMEVPAIQRWVAAGLGDRRERRRLRWRYIASGYRPEPLPAHREPVEAPTPGRVGICCSGGGIRSAAFNLGALQTLQDAGRLQQADYLAAVSGGSYIAAAFAMVAKTSADEHGSPEDSDPDLIKVVPPFRHGSPEEQYLRNRCDYLAPDGMAKLYLVLRIILGLVVNLIFLSLPLMGLTILLGTWIYRPFLPGLVTCPTHKSVGCATHGFSGGGVHLPLGFWIIPVAIAVAGLLLGAFVMVKRMPSNGDELQHALQTWSTRLVVIATGTALLTIALPELVALFHAHGKATTGSLASPSKTGGVAGIGIAGLLAGVAATLREAFADASKTVSALGKLNATVRRLLAKIAAAVLGPLLLYSVIVFAMSIALANAGSASGRLWLTVAAVLALGLFVVFYNVVDITALSLHPFYKRRLCTAFALKRVRPKSPFDDAKEARRELTKLEEEASKAAQNYREVRKRVAQEERQRQRAKTGSLSAEEEAIEKRKAEEREAEREALATRERVDAARAADVQQDELGVAAERPFGNLVRLSRTGLDPSRWPTLIVCAAANISEPGATPPGRRVTSFTFSCRTIGGPLVGAERTVTFEEVFKEQGGRRRDLSLPSAVAMSGAAVAPSMGKISSSAFRFLLALANIRLGVWVPNPRWVAGAGGWKRRPTPSYLIRELLGRNRVDSRYLFVTDGGHYENLGLVELLRRGCTRIYCFDASGGERFDALGDAVALARSELGVEIKIDPDPLRPGTGSRETGAANGANGTADGRVPNASPPGGEGAQTDGHALAAKIAVRGTFTYADETEGELVYARNVMSPGAPWDVRARHIADPAFPHNSTADQLYTDQKFESYRRLGVQAAEQALHLVKSADRPSSPEPPPSEPAPML